MKRLKEWARTSCKPRCRDLPPVLCTVPVQPVSLLPSWSAGWPGNEWSILEEAVLVGSADVQCSWCQECWTARDRMLWAPREWVTNDQNSQSVQPLPPQLQGQGTTWLCTFIFLLPLIKERFVHQPSKSPAAWCVWDVLHRMCSQVMWWKFWGVGHHLGWAGAQCRWSKPQSSAERTGTGLSGAVGAGDSMYSTASGTAPALTRSLFMPEIDVLVSL